MLNLNVITDDAEADREDDGVDVADLVRMFEESEESTYEARQDAERDRDYADNIQYTAAELAEFRKRGQPPMIDNRIKSKVDYLVGLEKQQRVDPRALPRTPAHEEDADGATQALRYVEESEDFDNKRSGVWRNLLVEGAGGISVSVSPDYNGEMAIRLTRVSWDRMFWDPHSSETDFSDAGYLGVVIWMDYADALTKYKDTPNVKEILDVTMSSAGMSDTYDDKPKYNLWADRKRKRVRICEIWLRRDDEWHFAEYTKGGILKAGPSPYLTDKGETDCGLLFQSAYVDRDNNRYGLVREMISLQDGINKRHSKALHLLNVSQTVFEDGAVEDVELFRREANKPDGTMVVAHNALAEKRIQFNTRTDLAEGHFKLLQAAQNAIDLKGPNATAMGDKAQGSSAASGKAIIASQQGGMVALGDLLDNLRHLDKRVFRAIWARIRQFWTAEKWIRITDDEQNIKWVAMNVDQMQLQMAAQQNPAIAQRMAGAVANVAELDCDIIIDDAPDNTVPALEQFEALVNLKQYDTKNELPFKAILLAMPNLKEKRRILEEMDKANQPNPANQIKEKLTLDNAQAEIFETQMSGELKKAQAIKTSVEAQLAPAQMQQDAINEQQNREERFAMKGADMSERDMDRRHSSQESEAERQARNEQARYKQVA